MERSSIQTDKRTGAGVFEPGTKHQELMGIYRSVFQVKINAIGRSAQTIRSKELQFSRTGTQP